MIPQWRDRLGGSRAQGTVRRNGVGDARRFNPDLAFRTGPSNLSMPGHVGA
jgi:hypothetical protein